MDVVAVLCSKVVGGDQNCQQDAGTNDVRGEGRGGEGETGHDLREQCAVCEGAGGMQSGGSKRGTY